MTRANMTDSERVAALMLCLTNMTDTRDILDKLSCSLAAAKLSSAIDQIERDRAALSATADIAK
jgi:hypothetical protein